MNLKFYHVSRMYLGKSKVFLPKIPESAVRSLEDVETPRICVAPTIIQCLMGIAGTEDIEFEFRNKSKDKFDELFVYTPMDCSKVSPAGRIPDFQRTKEHWILEPCEMSYLGKINKHSFDSRTLLEQELEK